MTCEDLSRRIGLLIKGQAAFAAYRVPGETGIHSIRQNGEESPSSFTDITTLNGRKGFVIAPFHPVEECPAVLINGTPEVWEYDGSGEPSRKEPEPSAVRMVASGEYAGCFARFMQHLRDGGFQKLVLSKQYIIRQSAEFPLAEAFLKACRRYPRSYVYLCYSPQTGVWLGCTPEILLSGEDNEWHTVALAGTRIHTEGVEPQWDEKNIQEQRYVADYVRSQLRSINVEAKEEGPYPAHAGGLVHLKTDFSFPLPDTGRLGDVLQLLHPTPAVCGLPKVEAYRFILENENHDRRYYAGFIGEINPCGKTLLYVNLRCMQVMPEQLVLYAGSGLLPSSTFQDEWQETEDKLSVMKAVVYGK